MKVDINVKDINIKISDHLYPYAVRLSITTDSDELVEVLLPKEKFINAVKSALKDTFNPVIDYLKEELEKLRNG